MTQPVNMEVEELRHSGISHEDEMFRLWMNATASHLGELMGFGGFDSLSDSEFSAVSALFAGAIRCQFVASSEHSIRRKRIKDKRKWGNGRADLWFASNDECYSFEFKLCKPTYKWTNNPKASMDKARCEAKRANFDSGDSVFASVISLNQSDGFENLSQEILDGTDVNLAYRLKIDGKIHSDIYFSRVTR